MKPLKQIIYVTMFTMLMTICLSPMVSAESETVKQSEATVELTSGLLTLDYVSLIDFGTHEISNTMVFESTTLEPMIQVSDKRGTGQGWSVTAKASLFTNEEGLESLQGAKIIFMNGEAVSESQHHSGAPDSNPEVILHTGGDAALVVSAPVNKGLGTWINRWLPTGGTESAVTNDNVMLDIPSGSATIGKHKAIITWTLTDAPGQ